MRPLSVLLAAACLAPVVVLAADGPKGSKDSKDSKEERDPRELRSTPFKDAHNGDWSVRRRTVTLRDASGTLDERVELVKDEIKSQDDEPVRLVTTRTIYKKGAPEGEPLRSERTISRDERNAATVIDAPLGWGGRGNFPLTPESPSIESKEATEQLPGRKVPCTKVTIVPKNLPGMVGAPVVNDWKATLEAWISKDGSLPGLVHVKCVTQYGQKEQHLVTTSEDVLVGFGPKGSTTWGKTEAELKEELEKAPRGKKTDKGDEGATDAEKADKATAAKLLESDTQVTLTASGSYKDFVGALAKAAGVEAPIVVDPEVARNMAMVTFQQTSLKEVAAFMKEMGVSVEVKNGKILVRKAP